MRSRQIFKVIIKYTFGFPAGKVLSVVSNWNKHAVQSAVLHSTIEYIKKQIANNSRWVSHGLW